MTRPRRAQALVTTALLLGSLVWAAATGAQSTGASSPQYPGSQLAISLSKSARANSIVTVTFSGANALFTEGAPITYTLTAFVQARSALPRCAPSYNEEFNTFANLAGRSIIQIATGLSEGLQGPFRFRVKYRSGPTRRIVICAYSRLITDDAAYAQLRTTLARPRRH